MSGMYMFAQARRTALSSALFLQRKCLFTGHDYGNSQKLAQQQSGPASAMHDFSRIRVHDSGTPFFFLPEMNSSGRVQEDNGDTGCDVSKGEPDVKINQPSLCYRSCTEQHEEKHRSDIRPCCQKANTKWKAAKTDDQKDAIQDKMNKWVEANGDWLQCRAYAESVRCADEFLKTNCGAKKSEAEQAAPQDERASATAGGEGPEMMAGGPEDAVGWPGPGRIADDTPKDPPLFKPEICCSTVKDYRRHSDIRREAFCKTGNKGPTPCPF